MRQKEGDFELPRERERDLVAGKRRYEYLRARKGKGGKENGEARQLSSIGGN